MNLPLASSKVGHRSSVHQGTSDLPHGGHTTGNKGVCEVAVEFPAERGGHRRARTGVRAGLVLVDGVGRARVNLEAGKHTHMLVVLGSAGHGLSLGRQDGNAGGPGSSDNRGRVEVRRWEESIAKP